MSGLGAPTDAGPRVRRYHRFLTAARCRYLVPPAAPPSKRKTPGEFHAPPASQVLLSATVAASNARTDVRAAHSAPPGSGTREREAAEHEQSTEREEAEIPAERPAEVVAYVVDA